MTPQSLLRLTSTGTTELVFYILTMATALPSLSIKDAVLAPTFRSEKPRGIVIEMSRLP